MSHFGMIGYGITKHASKSRRTGCLWLILIIALAAIGIGCVREVAGAAEIGARTKEVTVTAYNSVPWQTDSTPCISADGSDICALEAVGDHSCAAALPFGTRIRIPGFGECTVRDRLARRHQQRIDIHFGGAERVQDARVWGKRRLIVTIKPGFNRE